MKKTSVKIIGKWTDIAFESSSTKTKQFVEFAKDYKRLLKEEIKESGYTIEKYLVGHFEISGFLRHTETGRYVYFAVPDVRIFTNDWYQKVLVRTAESDSDFLGGADRHTHIARIGNTISEYPFLGGN